jgi:hypothetical protein
MPPPPPPHLGHPPLWSQQVNHPPSPHAFGSEGIQHEGDHQENRRQWLPKMDLPHFDGSDACVWLHQCTSYFTMYQIPLGFCVSAALIHMSGPTAHWFQLFKHSPGCYQWEVFAATVVQEFKLDTHRALTMQLITFKQVGSVAEYRKEF